MQDFNKSAKRNFMTRTLRRVKPPSSRGHRGPSFTQVIGTESARYYKEQAVPNKGSSFGGKSISKQKTKPGLNLQIFKGYGFSALQQETYQAKELAVEMLMHALVAFPFENLGQSQTQRMQNNKARTLKPKFFTKKDSTSSLKTVKSGRRVHTLTSSDHIRKNLPKHINYDDLQEDVVEFVEEICSLYNKPKFHNFHHAIDVCQMFFTFLTTTLSAKVDNSTVFMCLVIALCHDIAHPGVNFDCLKKLGILSEFKSLEQFHIKVTTDLIQRSPLFAPNKYFSASQLKRLDTLVKLLIDATDISQSKSFCNLALLAAKERKQSGLKMISDAELCMIIKISDLANLVRDFDDAESWSSILAVEMKTQEEILKLQKPKGDLELEQLDHIVMQCQELMQEQGDVYANLPKNTMWFIENVVIDMVKVVEEICPNTFHEYSSCLRRNQLAWRSKTDSY